jgi:hypothetical protein
METKKCSLCKEEKLISDNFGSYTDKKNGRLKVRSQCKQCRVKTEGERSKTQRDKCNERNRKYKESHKEKIQTYNREYVSKKRNEDIQYRLRSSVTGRMRTVLETSNVDDLVCLIGCSPKQCKHWLSYQFDEHMSWDNHGTYWQIDHVIPLSVFDMTLKSQQVLACNWSNIRPLKGCDNRLKTNEIVQNVILEHLSKVETFVSLNGYQASIETCWWRRHNLWYGKNPEDERNYTNFLKRIIRNENANEEILNSLV